MDSKYVRKTVDNLLAELERNPAIGRRMSPSFMSRYGRPLGLGIALGVSGVAGCSGSSEESKNPDALPAAKDALDGARDAYGISWEVQGSPDLYRADVAQPADTRDALSYSIDAYGIRSDAPVDTRDALGPTYDIYVRPLDTGHVDVYGVSGFPDARLAGDAVEALPPRVDAYGMVPDRPADTRDASPAADADDVD